MAIKPVGQPSRVIYFIVGAPVGWFFFGPIGGLVSGTLAAIFLDRFFENWSDVLTNLFFWIVLALVGVFLWFSFRSF